MRTLGLVFLALLLGQWGCYSTSEYRGPGVMHSCHPACGWAKYMLVLPALPSGKSDTTRYMSGLPSEPFFLGLRSPSPLLTNEQPANPPPEGFECIIELWDEAGKKLLSTTFSSDGKSWKSIDRGRTYDAAHNPYGGSFQAANSTMYKLRIRSSMPVGSPPPKDVRPCFFVFAPVWP